MKNENKNNVKVVQSYFDSLGKGDLNNLASLFDDEVIWHQPGAGKLSGVYKGKEAVFALFGKFMEISQGSFKINSVDSIMANGKFVSAILSFSAHKASGEKINMAGVDLMKVENGKIKEVYLFSGDQQAEDHFWS